MDVKENVKVFFDMSICFCGLLLVLVEDLDDKFFELIFFLRRWM